MSFHEKIKNARFKTIGTKQTIKAIKNNKVNIVFIARDAESRVINPVIKLAEEKNLKLSYVDYMKELGEACGIEVGTASAGILLE
jgi:large subunit ribosomal protein L7A